MGSMHIFAQFLLFTIVCVQSYEISNTIIDPSQSPVEVYNNPGLTLTGQAASNNNNHPNVAVPIVSVPYQEDAANSKRLPETNPVIYSSNETDDSSHPAYIAVPMKIVYEPGSQFQKRNQKQASDTLPPYYPDIVALLRTSLTSDPSFSSASAYPANPSGPTIFASPNDPSVVSASVYANDPSYANTPPRTNNPPSPSVVSNSNNPQYSENQILSKIQSTRDTELPSTNLDKPSDDYEFHGVKPPAKLYPCAGYSDGKTYGVRNVCFAYFECVKGESLYRQCDDHYRFDQISGQCVQDTACLSACPKQWKPHPLDIHKFILGGTEMDCPYGTFFDYKICTCQSKNNLPKY